MRVFLPPSFLLLSLLAAAQPAQLSLLIVDGQNNHDFKATTKSMKATLESCKRFQVSISRTPARGAKAEAWAKWRPEFRRYALVVLDYNGEAWPKEREREFEAYVRGGGGVVVVHAANNGFPKWKAFEDMVGLLWRPASIGTRVCVDDASGAYRKSAPGVGPGAGHGVQHDYRIRIRKPGHPVMKGLPSRWLHAKDELYHGQRGPAAKMTILSSAYSDPRGRGTGAHEPLTWCIPFGRGRVLTTVMGHHWRGQKDFNALHCVGFQTLLCRGAEWVATGLVTLQVPERFPRNGKTSIVEPADLKWP